jgi:Raf kinase inhibitor-like YbhB/YbcL family protein
VATIRGRTLALAAGVALGACQSPSTATPTALASPASANPVTIGTVAPTAAAPASQNPMQTPLSTPRGPFTITSTAFAAGGSIPRTNTCDGQDSSPPLTWTALPDRTQTLVLIVDDPDARGFVHWVVFNIAANAGELRAGIPPSAGNPAQGRNSFGRVGYGGPCPPSGTHHYVFRLLALESALPLAGTPTASQVLVAAKGHVLGEAKLIGAYHRG